MIDTKKFLKYSLITLLVIAICLTAFWAISKEQLLNYHSSTEIIAANENVGELVNGYVLEQKFKVDASEVTGFSAVISAFYRENTSNLVFQIWDNEVLLSTSVINTQGIKDGLENQFMLDEPLRGVKNKVLSMKIYSDNAVPGNAVTLWFGNQIDTGKARFPVVIEDWEKVTVNGNPLNGKLCARIYTNEPQWFGEYYLFIALGLMIAAVVFAVKLNLDNKNKKETVTLNFINVVIKYNFLIRQMIKRSFKTKYKRSVLGVFWSFLNPLFTLCVQYFVFSTIFKSDVENFVLYLLIGIVLFNFFLESTGTGAVSITTNTHLITKVYVPKYIYPITAVLSSSVNLLISMIPLALVMIFTKTAFAPSIFLLPFLLINLIAFTIGMVLILSSTTVFFRDINFLWGVLSMLWMYITPIFYPESIIPRNLIKLYRANPMYQYITFAREILINGVSPAPASYFICFFIALITLIVGGSLFSKLQDKFIFYL